MHTQIRIHTPTNGHTNTHTHLQMHTQIRIHTPTNAHTKFEGWCLLEDAVYLFYLFILFII